MTETTDEEEEQITQFTCALCRLPIVEVDPFEFLFDGRPAHEECWDRRNAGQPPVAAVSLCSEVHEVHGACVMFAGHRGRHRTRDTTGRLLAAWWGPAAF